MGPKCARGLSARVARLAFQFDSAVLSPFGLFLGLGALAIKGDEEAFGSCQCTVHCARKQGLCFLYSKYLISV